MKYPDPKYFDYSASEPPYPEALDVARDFAIRFPANPSSAHVSGKEAARVLVGLKIGFCELMGSREGHLLLCSSATEANNTVIEGYLRRFPGRQILVAEDVHDSIWYATEARRDRADIIPLTVLREPALPRFREYLKDGTGLVCINHVCNESGHVQRLDEIAALCEANDIRLLVDGSQAVGHLPVDLDRTGIDYYCFSSHKFGGPRGTGGIVLRDRQFDPLLKGGAQEWGLRAGTENLAGLAGAKKALELSLSGMDALRVRLEELKRTLLDTLSGEKVTYLVNTPENCRPGFISLSFPGMKANEMVASLSVEGFKTAMGSACHSDRQVASRIILASGRSREEAIGTIRVTMGRGSNPESVETLARAIRDLIWSGK